MFWPGYFTYLSLCICLHAVAAMFMLWQSCNLLESELAVVEDDQSKCEAFMQMCSSEKLQTGFILVHNKGNQLSISMANFKARKITQANTND